MVDVYFGRFVLPEDLHAALMKCRSIAYIETQEELDELRAMSKRINELMTELFAKGGVRLVDFKLEFGRTDEGLVLCDEISPDSCRLWDMETNKKLDKDRFRRDMGGVEEAYEKIMSRLLEHIR